MNSICVCKRRVTNRTSDINLIRQAPRSLESDEPLDEDIKRDRGSTSLLLSNVITIPNIDRLTIQLLLPDDKDEVVLGELSIPNLLLKSVFAVVHVSPESGCGEILLYFGGVVFLCFTKHVRSENPLDGTGWNEAYEGRRHGYHQNLPRT